MSWGAGYDLSPDHAECRAWHSHYYESGIIGRTSWLGTLVGKYPSDLLVYAEILHRTRPDFLIETGTNYGGSALFFGHVMDALGTGHVITIDPFPRADGQSRPQHPRITYLQGSSTDWMIADYAAVLTKGKRTMVSLDSVHAAPHVARELELYAPLVTPGCYCVVEDTNLNGHPVAPSHGPGPMEAVQAFLASPAGADFAADRECERFGVSMHPNGWLRRVR